MRPTAPTASPFLALSLTPSPRRPAAAWLLCMAWAAAAHPAHATQAVQGARDTSSALSQAAQDPMRVVIAANNGTTNPARSSSKLPHTAAPTSQPGKTQRASGEAKQRAVPAKATAASSAAAAPLPANRSAQRYAGSAAAEALAERLAVQHGLPATWVREQLALAQRNPTVIRLMTPAPVGTRKNWITYRARFIEPVRLRAGQRFWQEHRATLARAEATYGVPASLIVGVIGIETLYGRHTGDFRVLDALSTLALDFPASHPRAATRSAFFQDELGHFLALMQQLGRDPVDWRGSFAGAMGWPQFMPSSWRRFAVDFDGDGQIDLINSVPDVIGSVANYFVAHGWKTGIPTHYPLALQQAREQVKTLLEPDILPTFSASDLLLSGLKLTPEAQNHVGKLALVELENGAGAPSYLVGTENFYVVTRYNWSSYYALAVIELGQAIEAKLQ